MMRWLSQLWVSTATDHSRPPGRLWQWTFGRFKSHRAYARRMTELDAQLRRQAASQQRALASQPLPVGRYPSKRQDDASDQAFTGPWRVGFLKPALAVAACAVVGIVTWVAWPDTAAPTSRDFEDIAESLERLGEPVSQQVQTTWATLQQQTDHVRQLPDKVPPIDRVVNDLGEAIQNPIREEVRRLTRDMTEPWIYLANQLPLPVGQGADPQPDSGA